MNGLIWIKFLLQVIVQFSRSVVSDSLQPQDCSTPGLPVHHQLLELAQTHVHRVSDAIQSSHHLPSPAPPALSPSQRQGLFLSHSSTILLMKSLTLSPSSYSPSSLCTSDPDHHCLLRRGSCCIKCTVYLVLFF